LRLRLLPALGLLCACALAQTQVTFRYFYDGNGQLFRVLDSSGNLVEYDYDLSGNPTQIQRSTVAAGTLAILNVVPSRGLPGQTITIYGQNFSATASGDVVKINGITATVLSASATMLVVQIPSGVTSGPVTVTVGGNTVSSGNLNFTVPPVPVITSITPPYGSVGQTLTGVVVTGTNLDGSTFDLGSGGTVTNVIVASGTQATFNLTIGQFPGVYVLTANGNGGISTTIPAGGNVFHVYYPAGDNLLDTRFSTFNTAYPPGYTPNVPAGSNEVDRRFSAFNTAYPPGYTPNVPAGSNEVDHRFSVFNTSYPPGYTPNVAAGSNEAFRLFSTKNTSGAAAPVPQITMSTMGGRPPEISRRGGEGATNLPSLIAGQTVRLSIGSPLSLLRWLQFEVNGVPLSSSENGVLEVWFTAPSGVDRLEFKAAGQTAAGQESDSEPQRIAVMADPGRAINGRVVDQNGQPMVGAEVTWQANGLAAEYFRFSQRLAAVPDLSGRTAERTGYVSALNYPNPREVFGKDPMGIALGTSYAARFHGQLLVETAGLYQFLVRGHAGARLSIDGQPVAAQATLGVGAHELEVVYFGDDSAGSLELLWTKPGGLPEVVPPAALRSAALPGWTAMTDKDGRFALRVPAALDGLLVKTASGAGSVELDSEISNRVR